MFTFYVIAGVLAVGFVVLLRRMLDVKVLVGAGLTLGVFLVSLIPYPIVAGIDFNNQVYFNEYWNGSEKATSINVKQCERDGSCDNTYNCDPYTVTRVETYTDSDGNTQSRIVTETHYHSCPYSSEETRYNVETTLGEHNIGGSLMTGAPYRDNKAIPGGQVTEPPKLWVEANERIKSGNPGGATKVNTYKNYILASEYSIMKKYSDAVEEYKGAGLLPEPTSGVHDYYQSFKLGFAGKPQVDLVSMQEDVGRFNGRLGSELQGDMRVVVVEGDLVKDPDRYAHAVEAYWFDESHDRNRLAKNALVVIIGVDEYKAPAPKPVTDDEKDTSEGEASTQTTEEENPETIAEGTPVVSWARAFTGMPLGNEQLLATIQNNLQGLPADETLIGSPAYDPVKETYKSSGGALETIVFDTSTFERISMDAIDENDKGSGFNYLKGDIQMSTTATVVTIIISSLILIIGWGAIFFLTLRNREQKIYF